MPVQHAMYCVFISITSLLMRNVCVMQYIFSNYILFSACFISLFFFFLYFSPYHFILFPFYFPFTTCCLSVPWVYHGYPRLHSYSWSLCLKKILPSDLILIQMKDLFIFLCYQIQIWCYFSIYKHINFCDQNLCLKTSLKNHWIKILLKNWKIL